MSATAIIAIAIFIIILVYSIRIFLKCSHVINKLTPEPFNFKKQIEQYSGTVIFYDEMTNVDLVKRLPKFMQKNDILLFNVLDKRNIDLTLEITRDFNVIQTPMVIQFLHGEVVEKYLLDESNVLPSDFLKDKATNQKKLLEKKKVL